MLLQIVESPGKTFSKRLYTSHFKGDIGNGPGAYSPQKKKRNLSYSIAAKLDDYDFKKRNFVPGPGNYEM